MNLKFVTKAIPAAIFLLASIGAAAVISVDCNDNDRTWKDDGSGSWDGQRSASIGYDGNNLETAHILVFELPDLGGETIESANLEMHMWDSAWGESLSLDLYGVRASSSSTTLFADFYRGSYDTSGANGVPIAQAYATKTKGNPAPVNERQVNTDASADLALGAWLSSLYASGSVAGDYAILRINPDTDYITGSNSYIYTDTGDTTSVQSGATYYMVPQLTITTVPEPTTLVMLAIGSLTACRRKR